MRATCRVCLQDMGAALTCRAEDRPGVTYYGQDVPGLGPAGPRCRGCGVVVGGVHHPFCCIAGCLVCEDQRLLCPCDDAIEPL